MQTPQPTLELVPQLAQVALQFVADHVRGLIARAKRRRRMRATYLALHALDTRTLRDLGFHRSEMYSVAAELAGAVESTRRSRT